MDLPWRQSLLPLNPMVHLLLTSARIGHMLHQIRFWKSIKVRDNMQTYCINPVHLSIPRLNTLSKILLSFTLGKSLSNYTNFRQVIPNLKIPIPWLCWAYFLKVKDTARAIYLKADLSDGYLVKKQHFLVWIYYQAHTLIPEVAAAVYMTITFRSAKPTPRNFLLICNLMHKEACLWNYQKGVNKWFMWVGFFVNTIFLSLLCLVEKRMGR